jgi:hypothetical protein
VVSSGEEEEESLEPIITKVETKEALKKHTDKLCCMAFIYLDMIHKINPLFFFSES